MKKLKAFTMMEILLIAIVMWTALLSILAVIKKMEQSNIKVSQNVVATNLAVQWYELFRAQIDDIRYDDLLSIYGTNDANILINTTRRVHWVEEWIYYTVMAEQISWLNYTWDWTLDSGQTLSGNEWDWIRQMRILLWAVCSWENSKLSSNGKCFDGDSEVEGDTYIQNTWIIARSWICLTSSWWIPCTGKDAKFHREIVVTQDVNRCGFGTWTFGETWANIACEWTWDDTIYRYRYGYNVCSRVYYTWQWWTSKKEQMAEICAKIN